MQNKNLLDNQTILAKRDNLLLTLQIAFYLAYVSLCFVISGIYPAVYIIKLICIIVTFSIKLYRESKRNKMSQISQLQMGFFVVYLLTAFELVFSYQVTSFILSTPLLICAFSNTIQSILNYSLFTNPKTINKYQFVIYSLGIVCIMCINVKGTILTIELFSQQQGGDYLQNFILLATSTTISIGAVLLEKMYKAFKDSPSSTVDLQEMQTSRKQMQIQLIQNTRNN